MRYDITDLNIGDKQIGAFKNNESTSYLVYDTFNFDGGMPDEECSGIIADSEVICSNIFIGVVQGRRPKITVRIRCQLRYLK